METLKIMQSDGRSVLERDLSEVRPPVMIVEKDGALAFSESSGPEVVAALFRDEDGWVLASPDPDRPVRSGTKCDGSLPLLPGSSCSVGTYIFLLDSDASTSGDVLLWRIDKSPIAAEAVMAGRNLVAADTLRNGVTTVNPAVPGEELFSFYPTADGLDVVMPSGGRMSIARNLCFAVGGFEGVVMPSSEATAALKTARPFSYPSRKIRRRLLLALIGVVALFAGALGIGSSAASIERQADEPHGVVLVPGKGVDGIRVYEGDEYIFFMTLFRDMPTILGARPSSASQDLINRVTSLTDTQTVTHVTGFLESVLAIQKSIIAEQWSDLSNHLAGVDRKDFTIANGLQFLADAQEVSDFVNVIVPRSGQRIRNATAAERLDVEAGITNAVSGLSDNRFIASRSLSAYCDRLSRQYEVLNAYFAVYDRILSHPDELVSSEVEELGGCYLEVLRCGDRDIPGLLDNIQSDLRKFSERWILGLTDEFERKPIFRPELSAVGQLYELAANSGTDEKLLSDWKTRLKSIRRFGENAARGAYEKYRLLRYGKSEEGLALLDQIISVGTCAGRFYDWALSEKNRLVTEEKQ